MHAQTICKEHIQPLLPVSAGVAVQILWRLACLSEKSCSNFVLEMQMFYNMHSFLSSQSLAESLKSLSTQSGVCNEKLWVNTSKFENTFFFVVECTSFQQSLNRHFCIISVLKNCFSFVTQTSVVLFIYKIFKSKAFIIPLTQVEFMCLTSINLNRNHLAESLFFYGRLGL